MFYEFFKERPTHPMKQSASTLIPKHCSGILRPGDLFLPKQTRLFTHWYEHRVSITIPAGDCEIDSYE